MARIIDKIRELRRERNRRHQQEHNDHRPCHDDDRRQEYIPLPSPRPPSPPLYHSFEFFPPKTEAGVRNLQIRIEGMVRQLDPLFISVTFSPHTSEASLDVAAYAQRYLGVDVCLHVTCQGISRGEMRIVLNQARHAGIQNLLVLRGDPPAGQARWRPGQVASSTVTIGASASANSQDELQAAAHEDEDGFPRAIDLIKWIRKEYGDLFSMGVAGHPEGHSALASRSTVATDPLSDEEVGHLKEKVEAGADFILTQFFYDPRVFRSFVRRCRRIGIRCPIIPGVLPVQSCSSLIRMTSSCGVRVPPQLREEIERLRADDEQVKDAGCRHAADLCREVLRIATPSPPARDGYGIIGDSGGIDESQFSTDEDWYWGVDGLHFYTLNLERSVTRVLFELLGVCHSGGKEAIAPNDSDGASSAEGRENGAVLGTKEEIKTTTRATRTRALPWRPSALSSRARREQVRPINWANRPKSYVRRTEEWSWDEFPNGRWGDSASPAFGDLSTIGHFYGSSSYASIEYEGDDEHRTIMSLDGRDPSTPSDVFEVFARYVEGRVPHIPWSEGPLQSESLLIQEGLARLNRAGFLTINSQPSVDGAPSSHKVFGWGHPHGLVYQRAYCECFCSPIHLHRLRAMVLKRPALSLYATPRPGASSPRIPGATAGRVVVSNGDQVQVGGDGDGGDDYSVTALTWGAFPNREVVQPTIFDPVTFFGVWAEEAFSLWTTAWMRLYEPESDAYRLLQGIRDTYYLCAIVDNDYVTGNASSPSSRLWEVMLNSWRAS